MTVSFGRGENPLRADKLNAAFSERVLRTGDSMLGRLTLVGDPVNPFEAATKQYVDRFAGGGGVSGGGAYIGAAPPGNTLAPLWWDNNSGQLFIQYNDGSSTQWVIANSLSGSFLSLSGGTVTGPVYGPNFSSAAGTDLIISPGGNNHYITFGDPNYGMGTIGHMAFGGSNPGLYITDAISAQYYRTPGNAYNPGGSPITPVDIITNWYGSYTGSQVLAAVAFDIPSDTLDGTIGGGPIDLLLRHNVGSGAKNGRIMIDAFLNIMGPITGDTTTQQYQVTYFQAAASVNVGGTDTAFGSRGYMYGSAFQTILHAGATNWTLVNGLGEVDIAIETGASVADLCGGSIILLQSHRVRGARSNIGLVFGAQPGATPTWSPVIGVGGFGGPWPVAASGGIISTDIQVFAGNSGRTMQFPPALATYGIDFTKINFTQQTGTAFRSPAFAVDGSGQISLSNAVIANSATGIQIDIPKQIVTAVAVAAAGGGSGSGTNDYYVGDLLYDASGGQYRVSSVVSGGVTGITLLVAGVSASPPANPVATVGGSGLGCTLALTWAMRNTLTLQSSGGLLAIGGGMSFGTRTSGANNDMSQHILLHTAGYGLNVTNTGRLNHCTDAPGSSAFVAGTTDTAIINTSGVTSMTALQCGGTSGPTWTTGSTAPASTQPVGSIYSRIGGAVGATLYVSRGGGTWAAVAGV